MVSFLAVSVTRPNLGLDWVSRAPSSVQYPVTPPKTEPELVIESMVGYGTVRVSIGTTRARLRTTADSRATRSSSARRLSGMRNQPSEGTVEPKAFWIALRSERALKLSSALLPDQIEL